MGMMSSDKIKMAIILIMLLVVVDHDDDDHEVIPTHSNACDKCTG